MVSDTGAKSAMAMPGADDMVMVCRFADVCWSVQVSARRTAAWASTSPWP